jgi:predicted XRE-type DNA-binding protein
MANVVKGSGNVFADLGFPDAETHALKSELVRRVASLIKQQHLTQKAAAERMGVSQPDVSKILKGQFRAYSVERLTRFLNALGQDVEIAVKKPARRKARGRLIVHAA